MQAMMIINNNDGKSAFASNDVAAKNKVARNSQWQVSHLITKKAKEKRKKNDLLTFIYSQQNPTIIFFI